MLLPMQQPPHEMRRSQRIISAVRTVAITKNLLSLLLLTSNILANGISATYVDDGSVPEFTTRIDNISVAIGRDATFTCNIKNLGKFKVGWVKADSKAIQAIHNAVITHNPRVSVSGDFVTNFNLHINQVHEDDRGQYMCQINTDPMTYQTSTLDVMVPPDITQSTADLEMRQGESAKLECRADGYPTPDISWRREGNKPIRAKAKVEKKAARKVHSYNGTTLMIPRVTPEDMGAYLCIAKNTVPPAQSKRVVLYVQFAPSSSTTEQLVGAVHGKSATLTCDVSAYPIPLIVWEKVDPGNERNQHFARKQDYEATSILITGDRYIKHDNSTSLHETTSYLRIKSVRDEDEGLYRCVARNSLGVTKTGVRIYVQPPPEPEPTHYYSSQDDEDDEEEDLEEELDDEDEPAHRQTEQLNRSPPNNNALHLDATGLEQDWNNFFSGGDAEDRKSGNVGDRYEHIGTGEGAGTNQESDRRKPRNRKKNWKGGYTSGGGATMDLAPAQNVLYLFSSSGLLLLLLI